MRVCFQDEVCHWSVTEDDINVYTYPTREEIDMIPAVYDNITANPTYVTILEP